MDGNCVWLLTGHTQNDDDLNKMVIYFLTLMSYICSKVSLALHCLGEEDPNS